MSAAPVRPSTPYINAAPAIIAHPLALQFNRVSILIYSIHSLSKPMGGCLFHDPVDRDRPYRSIRSDAPIGYSMPDTPAAHDGIDGAIPDSVKPRES